MIVLGLLKFTLCGSTMQDHTRRGYNYDVVVVLLKSQCSRIRLHTLQPGFAEFIGWAIFTLVFVGGIARFFTSYNTWKSAKNTSGTVA